MSPELETTLAAPVLTVPTYELVGVIADCVPFALDDSDLPALNCVQVEWSGELLTAMATDQLRIAVSSWAPEDDPPMSAQDDLFTEWGGDVPPWGMTVRLDDAKELVSKYKLPAKEAWSPLEVEYADGQLTVRRTRESGHLATTSVIDTVAFGEGEMAPPDVRGLLGKFSVLEPVEEIVFNAALLADFAKVRQRNVMELRFTGSTRPVHVAIGRRFSGAIQPVRRGDESPDGTR